MNIGIRKTDFQLCFSCNLEYLYFVLSRMLAFVHLLCVTVWDILVFYDGGVSQIGYISTLVFCSLAVTNYKL